MSYIIYSMQKMHKNIFEVYNNARELYLSYKLGSIKMVEESTTKDFNKKVKKVLI